MPKGLLRRSLLPIAVPAIAAALAAGAAARPARAAAEPAAGSAAARLANALGYTIDLGDLPSPHPRPERLPASAAPPLHVRVAIAWSLLEKVAGQYDWSLLDHLVASHAEAGYAVSLKLYGANPVHADGAPDAWTEMARALAARFGPRVDAYVVGEELHELPAREAAYRLKLVSVAIQSADPGARVVIGDLDLEGGAASAFLEGLFAEDAAHYVDGVSLRGEGDLAPLKAQMLLRDPSAAVWLSGRRIAGGLASGGTLLRGFLTSLREEIALTLFHLDFDGSGGLPLLPALERIRATFTPGYAPLVESGRGLQLLTPMGQVMPAATVRLFDSDAKKVLLAYDTGPGTARGTPGVLVVDSVDLADPVLRDVAAGEQAPAAAFQKDDDAGVTRVAVPLADYPLVLEYRRFTSPLYGEEERERVTGERLPSVEEILAANQAFQAAQDATLVNLRADARIDYHFRIGTGATYDVTMLSTFWLDPKVGAEWEHREFYVNGIKWRSSRIPEFPLPQPEKVLALPLDIALDKRYTYRLGGEETIDGHDCWIVEFEPLEGAASLYRGRVWIDKKNHARVQIASLQTGLEPPILSNDEKDSYRPLRGPDGVEHWLLSRIDGQQVFTAAGRNLVLVREVTLSGHVVNDQGYGEKLRLAHASEHQILRETEAGPRYLERTADGGRVVKDRLDRDNLFLAGGVFYNQALDAPLPLAGLNYFNRDLGGRGIQTNVFFAGPLLFANVTHPDLFGTGLEGGADLFAQGFSTTDRPVRDGEEIDLEAVDRTTQRLALGLGWPFADFWKLKLLGTLEYQVFARDEDTLRGFVLPEDTAVTTATLQGEFNRSAWSVGASVSASRRASWGPWGDPNAGLPPEEEIGAARGYLRYEWTVSRDFFLPLNQKLLASVAVSGGSDLDRFSKYRFDFFGNRLRGFSGTGLRYSHGATTRFQYSFNLGEIIRFEAGVDRARVKDSEFPDEGYQSFTGAGISGQTILGPNLILSLDWGIALASDVDRFRGDQELLVTVLRLFP